MSTNILSESVFNEAVLAHKAGDPETALAVLFRGECDSNTLMSRLIGCRYLEDMDRVEDAENAYNDILESFSQLGMPCPLGLFHYLKFIARVRSADESLSFFNDLYFSESDHLTYEVYGSVAVGIAWEMCLGSPEARLETAMEIFRKGLGRISGTAKRSEMIISMANFLAFACNKLKLAQLELSRYLSGDSGTSKSAANVWETWEKILLEFDSDIDTIKAMYKMKETTVRGKKKTEDRSGVEDALTGIVTLSDFPQQTVESWLLELAQSSDARPAIHTLMQKLTIGDHQLVPESAVLESVLGTRELIKEEQEEVRDGGSEPTNHVYRPDTSKMLKYNPHDFSEKRVDVSGLPSALKNLIALLPSNHALKCANTQYMADQCIRLLVSVNLPVRSEELLATVDKRTRAAYEQKYARATPVPTKVAPAAPAVLIAKETGTKVKKEEIFDPVEYYNRQK